MLKTSIKEFRSEKQGREMEIGVFAELATKTILRKVASTVPRCHMQVKEHRARDEIWTRGSQSSLYWWQNYKTKQIIENHPKSSNFLLKNNTNDMIKFSTAVSDCYALFIFLSLWAS